MGPRQIRGWRRNAGERRRRAVGMTKPPGAAEDFNRWLVDVRRREGRPGHLRLCMLLSVDIGTTVEASTDSSREPRRNRPQEPVERRRGVTSPPGAVRLLLGPLTTR